MILPEVYLGHDDHEKQLKTIESSMNKYLHEQVFAEYKDAMIYVERTDSSGKVRSGIVGKIDLEQYDYRKKYFFYKSNGSNGSRKNSGKSGNS